MATTKSITPLPLRPSSPKEEEAGLAEAFATAVSVSRTPSGRKGKKEKAMKSVPRLEKVQSVELEHTASFSVGFGDGTVLLGDEDNRKLVKYSVDTKMGIEWSKDQPQGIRVHCNKTFTSNQIICQNDSSAPTHQYSLALHPQSTHQHDGRLCGSLSQDRIAYARKIRDMKYCLDVYQTSPTHTKVASLTPPGEAFQTEYISVSDHPDRGMAVLDEASRTLHLYDISYTHQHQVELPYHPHWRNAVTSFKDWIVIIDKKKCLHVHTWEGEKVCEFSNDKLGLGMRGILGIRQAGEEGLMLAAEPDHWKTDSLHLYHVK